LVDRAQASQADALPQRQELLEIGAIQQGAEVTQQLVFRRAIRRVAVAALVGDPVFHDQEKSAQRGEPIHMTMLSNREDARNIAASLEHQIRRRFASERRDGNLTVLLHGSILDPERWQAGDRPRDIDLLLLHPALSRAMVERFYAQLSRIELNGRAIILEKRVGPLAIGPEEGVTLQAAACRGLEQLSPVAVQALSFHARAVVGAPPSPDAVHRIDARTLRQWHCVDLARLGAAIAGNAVPYWQWTARGSLRRIHRFRAVASPAESAKLRRHVHSRLLGWSLIAASRGLAALAGFSARDMIDLAGMVGERDAFLAALARGLQKEA